ncbi:MAG TPA: transporter [Gemmatimonadaceae bacterium]|nr:transporter [Gemmatimonadaceae bacterium]
MRRGRYSLLLAATFITSSNADAQVAMPPVNMGGTSFMDGVAGPGVLVEPGVIEHYHASRFLDYKGNTIPGSNSIDVWSNLLHVGYITTRQLFGAFYGAEFLLPIASIDVDTDFGPKGKESGLGDLIVSPLILEWPNRTLFGKPYFSRFSVLAVLPTGTYSDSRPVNVGSNSGGAFAYYSLTLMPSPRVETSWRLFYLWNRQNSKPFTAFSTSTTQAGQAIHANYAVSYEVSRSLRLGANGYAFQQISDHRFGGSSLPNSKERVVAFGPGVVLSSGFWSAIANLDFETLTRNRPQGYRLNLTLRRVFPHMPPKPPNPPPQ